MMSRLSVIFFIIISSVLIHTDSSDVIYSAVLPHTVTALTGSCVQIPCTFNISNFKNKLQRTKNIYGAWLKRLPQFDKSESLVVFNSSENIITGFSHIELIGNLTESNCTTVFYNIMKNHTDLYYFRLQMEPDVFRATLNTYDSSKTVRINVTDSPQPPELKASPNISKYVMEGTAVNLTCSAEAPCPKQHPALSWSYIPKSANITTQLQEKLDKTQSVFSRMTFTVSYMDHRQNISCTVTYSRNISNDTTVESTRMLQVQFSPKETQVIIDPSASVSVGTNVTLTCKSKGSPSTGMNFTWYKRGQETPIAWTKKITFNVTQNNAGWYFCRAQNTIGNQSSEEIQLTVKEFSFISSHDGYVVAGCAGGSVAVLLYAVFFMRIKTFNNTSANGKHLCLQGHDTDVYYLNTANEQRSIADDETLIIYYGDTDISKLDSCIMATDFTYNEFTEIQYTQTKNVYTD